ncbi:hypothetical protein HEP87_54430 [Streptomyces sp. S1D4-11]
MVGCLHTVAGPLPPSLRTTSRAKGADHPLSRVGGHRLDADDLPDEPALAREQWTGIEVRHDEPAAYLDLWLATMNSGLSFGRLSIGSSARTLGPADPAIR